MSYCLGPPRETSLQNVEIGPDPLISKYCKITKCDVNTIIQYNIDCYIASAKAKRYWLIDGHVALNKCNVSLGQQVNNCCPLRPAAYINKQNSGESCKFVNSDFRAFCLKKYTIDREDMLLKLKFNYSSKLILTILNLQMSRLRYKIFDLLSCREIQLS